MESIKKWLTLNPFNTLTSSHNIFRHPCTSPSRQSLVEPAPAIRRADTLLLRSGHSDSHHNFLTPLFLNHHPITHLCSKGRTTTTISVVACGGEHSENEEREKEIKRQRETQRERERETQRERDAERETTALPSSAAAVAAVQPRLGSISVGCLSPQSDFAGSRLARVNSGNSDY
ncbi:hypothetical protein HanIR_Chr13g0622011 [Helianthus annuus]|nr:hypothetical protein HanIR_Chr13g0622011 [Helianthus annuus]